jgi:hypothetical protein
VPDRPRRSKPASKRISYPLAARFVAVMVELQECADCPAGLRVALDDARAEISPWYDTEDI